MSLAHARKVIAYWNSAHRENELDEAQTEYLETLSDADEYTASLLKWLRYRPKRGRAEAIARDRAHWRRRLRSARRRAARGVVLSQSVTRGDLNIASQEIATDPRKSRRSAGLTSQRLVLGGYPGLKTRSEAIMLRDRRGRLLATVIIAGQERELAARLLAVLSTKR